MANRKALVRVLAVFLAFLLVLGTLSAIAGVFY